MPNKGDPSKPDKGKHGDQELFRDLSSFRKEALHISQQDQDKWKEEANRSGQPVVAPKPPPKPDEAQKQEESRWDRIQRAQRKKQIALGLLAVCGVALVIGLDPGGKLRALFTRKPPPPVTPSVVAPPPSTVDAQILAEGYVVCRWELDWVAGRADLKSIAEQPFHFDWGSYEGPAAIFSPTRVTDPLDRLAQLAPMPGVPRRAVILGQLATFSRAAKLATERVLADALTEPAAVVRTTAAPLADKPETAWGGRPSLVAALCELTAGGDQAKARAWLVRAAADAAPEDPWPGRALALLDCVRGQPQEALKPLEARRTARPTDDFAGYQLAWLDVQAGKGPDADKVLAKLEEGADAAGARLLRAAAAGGAKEWERVDEVLGRLEADLAKQPAAVRARYSAVKGIAVVSRDPNQDQLARELLAKAADLDPKCVWADLTLARVYMKEKQVPEAAGSFRRYLRRFPTLASVRKELAAVLTDGQYFPQALAEYAELMFSDGPRDDTMKGVTFCASALGRPDLARYLLDRAKQLKGK